MTDSASQSLVDRGWTPEQFWEYLEAFVGDWETKTIRTMMADHGLSLAPAARITELEAERDDLRVAIFGNDGYDPILRNGNFVEMATATELGRLGAIDRAIAAEFELTRVEGVTIERCAKAVCSGCASGVGFNDAGFHEFRLHTFPCHASAIRSLPPLAKRGDQERPQIAESRAAENSETKSAGGES